MIYPCSGRDNANYHSSQYLFRGYWSELKNQVYNLYSKNIMTFFAIDMGLFLWSITLSAPPLLHSRPRGWGGYRDPRCSAPFPFTVSKPPFPGESASIFHLLLHLCDSDAENFTPLVCTSLVCTTKKALFDISCTSLFKKGRKPTKPPRHVHKNACPHRKQCTRLTCTHSPTFQQLLLSTN